MQLIGPVNLASMLVFLLILTTAPLANAECEFDGIYYDIKLLSIASSNNYRIDESTKESFLFGECEEHAILALEEGKIIYFDLDREDAVEIKLIYSNSDEYSKIYKVLTSPEFWSKAFELIDDIRHPTVKYEIRTVLSRGETILLFSTSAIRPALVVSEKRASQILLFVTSRLNEYRYMTSLLDIWHKYDKDTASSLYVAGDKGFVLKKDNRYQFVDYKEKQVREICSYENVLARAKKFPEGVMMKKFQTGSDGREIFHINLANYNERSAVTAIGLGCN